MKEEVFNLLKKYTKHENIELISRGNEAIFAALYCAKKVNSKKAILTVDQGGWFSYLKYPKKLKLEVELVKTDYGVVDLKDLNGRLKGKNYCAFIYSNPAGYFAEQPIKEIYEICKKNDCLVIMDVTGSIGSALCNGEYVDFIVGSFGKWKPVNLGYGGFLTAKKKEYFEKAEEIFNMSEIGYRKLPALAGRKIPISEHAQKHIPSFSSGSVFDTTSFDEDYLPELSEKLKNVKQRYALFENINKKIKKDLKEFRILHENKGGVNVIVEFSSEKEKDKIIDYCKKNNYQFTICPRYIRVNEEAVSIEVKREE